ncbi:MotA/TolQ/ExbB proton channel family protein [Pelosinus sp. IPA-1]|uniref:MotA/TolQ/ExbB proton channel family protein n=1 Tax=Pelosinus sp. IPA-1 TaxID=3029569 RepID=UPI00243626D9|nr:MotA/TolQ/ExbB proton channel family protein [Pelosinus sp. IPA-1]GMA98877.1 biopolymer transporter ExbB [Pelosinus sp. IPA-1]
MTELLMQSINLFYKGGPVMYFLVMCSLGVVAITVERFLYYRHAALNMQKFQVNLQPLLESQCVEDAVLLCENTKAVVGNVTAQGLYAYKRGSSMDTAMESAAMLAAARLRENLNYLSAIVTLAPLLGLLGTVVGMINSFSVFNIQAGQPMAITGGVGEALVATATGLTVAVMALVSHTYFSQRLDGLITDVEQGIAMVLTYLRTPVNGKMKRETHEIA